MANLSNIRKEILEIDIARPMAPTHVSFLFEPPLPISHFNELIRVWTGGYNIGKFEKAICESEVEFVDEQLLRMERRPGAT
jgi:hypothetical protein